MPEMRFHVRWPDDSRSLCYSPSSTIREAFTVGRRYPLAEFVQRSREALTHASERVAQRYGFGCGQALAQIRLIEEQAQSFAATQDAVVVVEGFEF